MSTRIGKTTLNCDFYNGKDSRQDTALENRLLEIVKSGKDAEEILLSETDGALLYQLSNIRKNLLSWYPFDKDSSVLEIGSDCGALTGLFCERAKRVVAVESSKTRSEINAYRNDYDNLEIIAGTLDAIRFDEKFDCITLIGALDRADSLVSGDEPQKRLLQLALEHLNPDGVLIVAAMNKYGLKYWSGVKEEDGKSVFDDPYDNKTPLLSRRGLEELLDSNGISNREVYYPVPDYKLPLYIYTDESLPEREIINSETVEYTKENLKLFSERKVSDELLKDGMYPDFANSYLIIGRK